MHAYIYVIVNNSDLIVDENSCPVKRGQGTRDLKPLAGWEFRLDTPGMQAKWEI